MRKFLSLLFTLLFPSIVNQPLPFFSACTTKHHPFSVSFCSQDWLTNSPSLLCLLPLPTTISPFSICSLYSPTLSISIIPSLLPLPFCSVHSIHSPPSFLYKLPSLSTHVSSLYTPSLSTHVSSLYTPSTPHPYLLSKLPLSLLHSLPSLPTLSFLRVLPLISTPFLL